MNLNLLSNLLQIRLFNYFQQELPSYWLRYGERVVVEMVSATFSLLSLTYTRPSMLGPVHLLALIDPSAYWLKKWMVSLEIIDTATQTNKSHAISVQLPPLQFCVSGWSLIVVPFSKNSNSL